MKIPIQNIIGPGFRNIVDLLYILSRMTFLKMHLTSLIQCFIVHALQYNFYL